MTLDFAAARENMVENQVRTNDVTDLGVQDAMRAVRRERLCPPDRLHLAYAEAPVEYAPGYALMEPRDVAKLLQGLRPRAGERALAIAAPYAAAVLAAMGLKTALRLPARLETGDLVGDGFDCAVRFGDPEPSTLVAKKLTDTRVVTLEERGRPEHPRDLARHDAIQFRDPATGRPFEWIFVQNGRVLSVTPKVRMIALSAVVMVALLILVQKLEIELRATPGLDLVDLFPDWGDERYPLYAYIPSRRHTPAKVRAFLDFVTAACGPSRPSRRA